MKVHHRRSVAAHKTSHRCLFSLLVGFLVHHSRLLCPRESFMGNVFETLRNDVPFTHAVNNLHNVQYTCMCQILQG